MEDLDPNLIDDYIGPSESPPQRLVGSPFLQDAQCD